MSKRPEMSITIDEAKALEKQGVKFKGATISQTMGPNWREIVWLHSPRAPNLGKKCYVSDSHTVLELTRMLEKLPKTVDIWQVHVTARDDGRVDEYLFESAMAVVLSGQKTWRGVRGVYKDVTEDKIEFRDHSRRLLLLATRIRGEVKTETVSF